MGTANISRKTAETDVSVALTLEGAGRGAIDTGVGFLDHMLTLLCKHGKFDLDVKCVGDTDVDDHHSVEDIGIVLGQALCQALGDKRGIRRYGSCILPMDEALILCAADLSGRSCLRLQAQLPTEKVGTFDTELVEEFFQALTREARMNLHLRQLDGTNSHHIIEAMFKALGRTLRQAVAIDPDCRDEIPSTKGVLA